MEPLTKRVRYENSGLGLNPRVSEQQESGYFQQSNGGGDLECRHFNTPEGCPYGQSCRFRHVLAEMQLDPDSRMIATARRKISQLEKELKILAPIQSSLDGRDVGQQGMSSGAKPKPCMKFFSTSGCPFGESCHFMHYIPGGLASLGLAPVISLSSVSASASQRKPAPPVGDPSVTVNGYKTKLCNRFNTPEGCKFGDRCHFAHGESDLRTLNNVSRGSNRRTMLDGPSGVAPPGFSNRPSEFSNDESFGNVSNFSSQGYNEPNPPGVTGSDGTANYSGPIGENVQVY